MESRHTEALDPSAHIYNDLANRAYPGSWFNLIAVSILAFTTSFAKEHPVIFYSVLGAHTALSAVRLWLLSARNTVFKNRPGAWRALLDATIVACGFVWGLFGGSINYVHKIDAAETMLVTTSVLGVTISVLPVLASELMNTAEARASGYGVMTADKWAATQNLQISYGGQKELVPDDKLWTNKFVK